MHLRGGKYGAFIGCVNYPECTFRRKFGQPGSDDGSDDGAMGEDPETGLPVERKIRALWTLCAAGTGKEAKRASIPKDIDDFDLEWALKLLALPRVVGQHPDTGKDIEAGLWRYGPAVRHDGTYGKLRIPPKSSRSA